MLDYYKKFFKTIKLRLEIIFKIFSKNNIIFISYNLNKPSVRVITNTKYSSDVDVSIMDAVSYFVQKNYCKLKMLGADLIKKERKKQVTIGYTADHDLVLNKNKQLVNAAILLLQANRKSLNSPYGWDDKVWNRLINKSEKERLIISGSFIAAELDRLNNKNSKDEKQIQNNSNKVN